MASPPIGSRRDAKVLAQAASAYRRGDRPVRPRFRGGDQGGGRRPGGGEAGRAALLPRDGSTPGGGGHARADLATRALPPLRSDRRGGGGRRRAHPVRDRQAELTRDRAAGVGSRSQPAQWICHDDHVRPEASERMPHYEAGLHEDAAPEAFRRGHRQAGLQRVALGPASGGDRGDRPRPRRASTATRTPRPRCCAAGSPTASRSSRPRSRSATAPARSCWRRPRRSRAGRRDGLRVALVLDVPAPGGRSPGPARSACRSPRATSTTSTRCSTEITAATQLVCRLQSEQPDRHPPAGDADRRVPASGSREHVTVIARRGLHRVPDRRGPDAPSTCWREFPNLVLLRTFCKVYGLAGLRVGYALGSAKFRAAVDAVRQPFSVNALAQVAAAEALRHADDVAGRVERNDRRARLGRGGAARAWPRAADTQANFSWIDLGDHDEAEVVAAPRRARHRGPRRDEPRRPRPHPGDLRHARRERAFPRGARRSALSCVAELPSDCISPAPGTNCSQ